MSVPSVNDGNLNSNAGSSNRLAGTALVGLAGGESVLDGMVVATEDNRR